MEDRTPKYPGRITLRKVGTTANTYRWEGSATSMTLYGQAKYTVPIPGVAAHFVEDTMEAGNASIYSRSVERVILTVSAVVAGTLLISGSVVISTWGYSTGYPRHVVEQVIGTYTLQAGAGDRSILSDTSPSHSGEEMTLETSEELEPSEAVATAYDMVMADEPETAGTPPTKANLLTDATAALIGSRQGLTDPDTPNEALALLGNRNLWGHSNLLDNWDFRNPVNGKGLTSYSSYGECIDGWTFNNQTSGTITISDAGLVIAKNSATSNPGIMRNISADLDGATVTATAMDGSGNLYTVTGGPLDKSVTDWQIGRSFSTWWIGVRYVNSAWSISISTPGGTLAAAKLELGDHQTLAHKDASGNWVLNDAGNYMEELAKAKAGSGARIQTGSYVGTGTYGSANANSITFDFVPKLFYLQAGTTFGGYGQYGYEGMGDPKAAAVLWIPGVTTKSYGFAGSSWSSSTCATISFSGNTLSWYGTDNYTQANHGGTTYYWVAIG